VQPNVSDRIALNISFLTLEVVQFYPCGHGGGVATGVVGRVRTHFESQRILRTFPASPE
jgi:hypothetical protein